MDRNTKKQYDAILVRILRKIQNICDENGIKWFLAYGSCLGAVRHKGIIPWDDDIDICMPRPDYDRFIEICRNRDLDGMELCMTDTTPGHFEYFARIVDKKTTLLYKMDRPFVTGVYIDVFPLDGAGDGNISRNYDKFMFWQRIHHFSHSYYSQQIMQDWLKRGKIFHCILALATSILRKPFQKLSLNRIDEIVRKYPFDKSDFVVFYIHVYYMRNVIKKSWIEETVMVPFQDMTVPIPKEYDAYLTHLYGDYMTPPPDNKKDARHIIKFVDLNERLSLEEIKERLRRS